MKLLNQAEIEIISGGNEGNCPAPIKSGSPEHVAFGFVLAFAFPLALLKMHSCPDTYSEIMG